MAGLLDGVLPYLYSQGDRMKRHIGGLLADPMGTLEQTAGGIQDSHRAQQGLLSQAFADKARPFKPTDKNAMQQAAMNMLTGPLGFAPAGITAWHGSPHVFDKFDSSKIGTGEGAQAYGHGLYLAEHPAVAGEYAKALANDGRGNVYKVDLPDSAVAKMLDWDKPLSQQAPEVQKAVEALKRSAVARRAEKSIGQPFDAIASRSGGEKTGQDLHGLLYEGFASKAGGEAAKAAQFLRKQGVPGIRYLDQASRSAGGTSNFVVFPGEEDILSILGRSN